MTDIVPAGWTEWSMGDVMAEFYDGPHATPPASETGAIYLGIKNITDDGRLDLSQVRRIAEADYATWTKRVEPRAGDLVFTYEATLHRYAVLPSGFRGTLGRRVALIRPRSDRVVTRYLHYVFLSPQWRRTIEQRVNIGSTVDRIPLIDFPRYPIVLPPLEYQQQAVRVLGAIDGLVEGNRQRVEILEEMARLLYRQWFVDFRFPGHEDMELVDANLGPIPKGWSETRLVEGCSLVMGQSPKSEYYNETGEGLPFHQGVSDFGARFPTHSKWTTIDNRVAEPGDILFSVRAPVGRINVAPDRLVVGRGLCAIRALDEHQNFLLMQLKDRFAVEDSIGGGTIFNAVTKKDMESIVLLRPTDSVVAQFEAVVAPMADLVANLSQQNIALQEARDLILPRLVTGELDVSELDLDLEAP